MISESAINTGRIVHCTYFSVNFTCVITEWILIVGRFFTFAMSRTFCFIFFWEVCVATGGPGPPCIEQCHERGCWGWLMQTLTIRIFIWIKRHLYLGVSLPQLATPDLDMAIALIYSPPLQAKIFHSADHDNGKEEFQSNKSKCITTASISIVTSCITFFLCKPFCHLQANLRHKRFLFHFAIEHVMHIFVRERNANRCDSCQTVSDINHIGVPPW